MVHGPQPTRLRLCRPPPGAAVDYSCKAPRGSKPGRNIVQKPAGIPCVDTDRRLSNTHTNPLHGGNFAQSGDYHIHEVIDQHKQMVLETQDAELDFAGLFPKLEALYVKMKRDPALSSYFASDCYRKYAMNNPGYTHFTGEQFDGNFGMTVATPREFGAAIGPHM